MNRNLIRDILGLILLAAMATAIAQHDQFDAAPLQAWVEGAGAAGSIAFMLVYTLAAVPPRVGRWSGPIRIDGLHLVRLVHGREHWG